MENREAVFRLEEIQNEILALANEAMEIVREVAPGGATARAESYWYPHIVGAVHKVHGYLGGSMFTIEDAIKEIFEEVANG